MIQVRGTNKEFALKVRVTVQSCINYLMPRLEGKVEVVVDFLDLGGVNGYASAEHFSGSRLDRPRDFEIEVNENLSEDDALLAICHEMVHVKQFARSELYYAGGDRIRWHGEWVDDIPYEKRGWEIEAYSLQTKLHQLAKRYIS